MSAVDTDVSDGGTGEVVLLDLNAMNLGTAIVLTVENCTKLFGSVANAHQITNLNVTCLDHAPVLTHQVCILKLLIFRL